MLHGKDRKGYAEKYRNHEKGAAQGIPNQRGTPFNAAVRRGDVRLFPVGNAGSRAYPAPVVCDWRL